MALILSACPVELLVSDQQRSPVLQHGMRFAEILLCALQLLPHHSELQDLLEHLFGRISTLPGQ